MEEDSLQLQDFEATENLNNNIACYDEYVEYDLNGNITHLQRYGRMQDDTFGTIDNLHVSLNGNQLSSVTDEAAKVVSEGAIDFNNADDGQSEYTYNSCGSLTSDTGRGIAMIEYDNCNNPLRIQFTNGNVTRYVYATDGRKLRTIYYTAMPNITVAVGETKVLEPAEILCVDSVDYMLGGSLILRNGRMDKYLFDEGYCQAKEPFCCIAKPVMFTGFFDEEKGEFISSVPTEEERKIYQELCERWGKAMEAIRNSDEFTFYYYNKDHLGNIREVVNDMGQINQVTNYYPFGSPYCDIQSTINPEFQPFKYNGKELDMMHGLNAYDYGARQYYSPLPVWDRIDPLAEKYYNVSPYAYCNNNPVNAVDVDGKDGVMLIDNDEQKITIKADYYVQTSGRISANRSSIPGYTKKEISGMNDKINRYLNDLGMSVSEGEYAGYLIQFDLKFVEGGNQIETKNLADNDFYENMHIGNTFSRWDSTFKPFIPQQNEDGTFSTVGGITANNTDIIMNVEYDSLKNRIHEIFHSFGFRDFKNGEKGYGIMNYPPLKPNQRDANNLIYSSILQIKK